MKRSDNRLGRRRSQLRITITPIASVMVGSLLTLLPLIAQWPVLPPFGLMMFLAWRLLRPEIWPLWIAVPLGFFDDLCSGQPIGSAMFLWTACCLAIEAINSRLLWRNYWHDWFIGALCITLSLLGGALFVAAIGKGISVLLVLPQIGWSVLAFPAIVRICVSLDRWRTH